MDRPATEAALVAALDQEQAAMRDMLDTLGINLAQPDAYKAVSAVLYQTSLALERDGLTDAPTVFSLLRAWLDALRAHG